LIIINTIDLHQIYIYIIANTTKKVGYIKILSYLCTKFTKKNK